jgi:uncharacterized membrane protein HdeD (DUF308 family)
MPSRTSITRLQGAYFVVTGLWSLAHYRSFEALTGRKTDRWLVRTVGLLVVVIGAVLLRHPRSAAAREIGELSSAAFVVGDVLAVAAGQSWIYIADAVVEVGLVAAGRVAPEAASDMHPERA